MDIKLFQFDSQSDYLPYYKTFLNINIDKNYTIFKLLQELKTFDEDYSCPYVDFAIKINGVYTFTNTKLCDIPNNDEIILEPISEYRCVKDLIIDNSDFLSHFDKVKDICDDSDWKFYQSLECEYYASEVLGYNKNYLGDSFFLFVDYLIDKYLHHEQKLLDIIDDKDNGIYLYEEVIPLVYPYRHTNNIVQMLLKYKFKIEKQQPKMSEIPKQIKDLSRFNIAYNSELGIDNEIYKNIITDNGANLIDIGYNTSGKDIYKYNKKVACAKATHMLDIAQNLGADYLLISEQYTYEFLKSKYKKIASSSSITIEIPVISLEELEVCE